MRPSMHIRHTACLLLFGAVLFGSSLLFAAKREAVANLEIAVEKKVTQLLSHFDPDIVVLATITEKKAAKPARLPMTAFTVKEVGVVESDHIVSVESIKLRLIGRNKTLNRNVIQLVQTISRETTGVDANISTDQLPDELITKDKLQDPLPAKIIEELKGLLETALAKQAPQEQTAPPPQQTTTVIPQTLQPTGPSLVSWLEGEKKNNMYFFYAMVIGAFLLYGIRLFLQQSGYNKLLQVLGKGFKELNVSGGSSAEPPRVAIPSDVSGHFETKEDSQVSFQGGETPNFTDLPDGVILSHLCDCYWSQNDNQAAFVWRKLSTKQKITALEKAPMLKEYGNFLLDVEPKYDGSEQDPSYLSPLPIQHLDNFEITEIVRSHPALLNELSHVRRNTLLLSALERVGFMEKAQDRAERFNAALVTSIEKYPPSTLRELESKLNITFKDFKEEEEFLKETSLPLGVKAQVPSLGWLLELTDKEIEKILEGFNSSDLASAWVGPEKVLNSLGQFLPEKKRQLVKFQTKSNFASRDSVVFKLLHQAAIERLRKKTVKENESDTKQNAA